MHLAVVTGLRPGEILDCSANMQARTAGALRSRNGYTEATSIHQRRRRHGGPLRFRRKPLATRVETQAGSDRSWLGRFSGATRTHASLGHDAGVDPKVAADQHGHGIVGVALDVYTKAAFNEARRGGGAAGKQCFRGLME